MKSLLVLLLAGVASAGVNDTLAQKEGWALYASELARVTTKVNDTCGSALKTRYDPSTWPSFDPATDRTRGACEMAVSTLSAICATDPGKESVRALSGATCRFSTEGTKVSRDGKALTVWIDPAKTSIVGKEAGSYSWASALREVL